MSSRCGGWPSASPAEARRGRLEGFPRAGRRGIAAPRSSRAWRSTTARFGETFAAWDLRSERAAGRELTVGELLLLRPAEAHDKAHK